MLWFDTSDIQQSRMRPCEIKELQCLRQYRTGDIQTARQALLDYLRLVEQEEASGLPFGKTSESKALAAARLTLIYRKLGDTALANQYLRATVVYARKDAEGERNKLWWEKTDDEAGALMLDLVDKIDEKSTHQKWRTK